MPTGTATAPVSACKETTERIDGHINPGQRNQPTDVQRPHRPEHPDIPAHSPSAPKQDVKIPANPDPKPLLRTVFGAAAGAAARAAVISRSPSAGA